MSQNSRLIDYFINEFYLDRTYGLAHITSPSFICRINSGVGLNFDEHVERMTLINLNAILIIDDIKSDDDKIFTAEFIIRTNENLRASGVFTFKVINGLLDNIRIYYSLTDDELGVFEALVLNRNNIV